MLNYENLVAQGRAKSVGVCWTDEELKASETLQRERKIARITAANYIRNGILTVEDYDNAVASDFKPLSVEEAKLVAEKHIENEGKKAIAGAPKVARKAKNKK
jgi:hypothetical protein